MGNRGDQAGAVDALAAGDDLALAAAAYDGQMLPWHYYRSPAYFAIERGVVHHLLGHQQSDHSAQAVELLTSGLAGLPADAQGADWAGMYLCHLAAAHGRLGDLQAADEVLERARAIARATRSGRLAALVSAIARRLGLSVDT